MAPASAGVLVGRFGGFAGAGGFAGGGVVLTGGGVVLTGGGVVLTGGGVVLTGGVVVLTGGVVVLTGGVVCGGAGGGWPRARPGSGVPPPTSPRSRTRPPQADVASPTPHAMQQSPFHAPTMTPGLPDDWHPVKLAGSSKAVATSTPPARRLCDHPGMRILFTATPGWGHVHPMVPLARALLERGHDVLWATGADACERLVGEGFRAVAAGLGEREAMAELFRRFPEIPSLAPSDRPEFMFPRLFGAVRAARMLHDLAPAMEQWSPRLVVSDAAEFAGHLQARVLGVPSVTHSFGALLPESRVAALARLIEPLWSERGLEPRPYGGAYDHLYVDIYPSSLQSGNRSHVPATQLLGPRAFATAGNEPLPEWVASGSVPLVYITFGTVFSNVEALSNIVEGVRSLPVRVIVTVGPHGDPANLGRQPDNVHVARYIPQTELLGRCAIVISHGGSGTFLGALAASVPQLCVPQAADQFLNAGACERAGVGLALQPGAVSAANVRGAVERLLSDSAFRVATKRISDEIAAMPSPGDVADRLASDFG